MVRKKILGFAHTRHGVVRSAVFAYLIGLCAVFIFVVLRAGLIGAATFTFMQTSWTGGQTSNNATASSDNSGWTQFSDKSGIVHSTNGQLTLDTTTENHTDTTDTHFDAGLQTQTDVFGSSTNATLILDNQNEQDVDTWNHPAPVPGSVGTGGALQYLGNGNLVYGLRGGGATEFWSYSVSSSSWQTLASVPSAVSHGGDLAYPGTGDYIYALRGGTTTTFWRYSISGNSWSALAVTPATVGEGGALVAAGNFVYAFRGLGTNTFWRYSIVGDSWTSMTNAPDIVDRDGVLEYTGSGDYIYAMRGSFSSSFWRYSIVADSWTSMSSAPSYLARGNDMIYPGTGDYIYSFKGDSNLDFWRYSISGNSWSVRNNILGTVHNGASLTYANGVIYAFRGNSTTDYWRYSITTDKWTTTAFTPDNVTSGGALVETGSADVMFALRGGDSTDFWKYTVSTDTWTVATSAPASVSDGGDLAYDSIDNVIYAFRGNSTTDFWRYSIVGNSWSSLTSAPSTVGIGGSLAYVASNTSVYAFKGGDTTFWRYSVSGNSWSTMAIAPASVGLGADLMYPGSGDYIYALRGGSQTAFWRYSISGDTWSSLAATPTQINTGGNLVYPNAGDYMYAFEGGTNSTFYRYSVLGNAWVTMTAAPGPVGNGGSIIYPGNDVYFYAVSGDNTNKFWRYAFSPNYYGNGSFESRIIDTTGNISFNSLSWVGGLPSGTTLTVKARSSGNSDMSGATAWGSCSALSSGSDPSAGGCVTDGHRYIQYYAGFATNNSSLSASIDDLTIGLTHYYRSATITSSAFNTEDPTNVIGPIAWDENSSLPASTTTKWQTRTAPDSSGVPGTWGDYLGPTSNVDFYDAAATGCTKTSSTVECITINTDQTDAANDQWFQIKLFITSDGSQTPSLTEVRQKYVINTAPTVTITNSPSESLTGTVTANFNIADQEESTLTIYGSTDIGVTLGALIANATTTSNLTLSGTNHTFFPSSGIVLIGTEMINYTGKSGTTLSGITRGVNASRAQAHSASVPVYFVLLSNLSGNTGSQSVGTGKSITWNLAATFNELYYASGKFKISAIDGNVANQMGVAEATLVLDTKDPTSHSILVDSRTNTLTLAATDNSALEMKLSNNSNLTADGLNGDSGNWIPYTTSKSWTPTAIAGVETVYAQFRDVYGNTTSTVSATTPATPDNVLLQDISNPEESNWRLFLSWGVITNPGPGFGSYRVYISTQGDDPSVHTYTLEATINDRTTNYYVDTNLDPDTTYYYRLVAVDANGNVSNYNSVTNTQRSTTTQQGSGGLEPNGESGTDGNAPIISSVAAISVTQSSATITWSTDELSNSIVGFSTVQGSYVNQVGVATMVTSHSVTLSNLTPGTVYYYKVISYDSSDNRAESINDTLQTFTTTNDITPPTISNISVNVTDSTAGIVWTTNESSTSQVEYGLTTSYGTQTALDSTLVAGHAVTLTSLTPSTQYHLRVMSKDASNNTATSADQTFTTAAGPGEQDVTGPSIAGVTASTIGSRDITIVFTTNEAARGMVEFGTTDDYTNGETSGALTDLNTTHSIVLTELEAETIYHYKVYALDAAGNLSSSSDQTVSTLALSEEDLAPAITEVKIASISQNAVTITWKTNTLSSSVIAFGTTVGEYDYQSGTNGLVKNHSTTISELVKGTRYYFKVRSFDSENRMGEVTSDSFTFTTLLDTAPPKISSILTLTTRTSAVISWTTEELSTSQVEIGTTDQYGDESALNETLVAGHSVQVTGLLPLTTYHFRVVSKDAAGNTAFSNDQIFETIDQTGEGEDGAGPVISNVRVENVTASSARILWDTMVTTSGIVTFGSQSTTYTNRSPQSQPGTSHIITISDLTPSTGYYFRIEGQDTNGTVYRSDEYVFISRTPPSVLTVNVTDITPNEVTITFETNSASRVKVMYTNTRTDELQTISLEEQGFARTHTTKLETLSANTIYNFSIELTQEDGVAFTSSQYSFTTPDDQKGPVINSIETRSTINEGEDTSVQTLISWSTNEPATSQVLYSESVGEDITYDQQTTLKSDYVSRHLVVLSDLKPSTTYQFIVVSVDETGNESRSEAYVMLTPSRRVSVFDLIFRSLEDTFSWVQNVGG